MKTKQKSAKTLSGHIRHHTKKILVPNKSNQYRPHLIRVNGLSIVLGLLLVAQLVYGFATTGHINVLGRVSNVKTADLLAYTNNARESEGLASVQLNDKLSQAAYLKAQDMFEMQYWSHTSPSGVQPWKWFNDVGYNYSVAGENLAKNYPTAQAAVQAWMDSETHRANILNQAYVDVGFAVVDGELNNQQTTLVVALYGAPVTVAAVQSASVQQTRFSAPAVSAVAATPFAYIASAAASLSPVSVASLILLAVVAIVGAAAHHFRKRLPKAWQKSWRVHHGMYTFFGMIALGVLVIIASGGGSI